MAMQVHPLNEGNTRLTCYSVECSLWLSVLWANLVVSVYFGVPYFFYKTFLTYKKINNKQKKKKMDLGIAPSFWGLLMYLGFGFLLWVLEGLFGLVCGQVWVLFWGLLLYLGFGCCWGFKSL